MRKVPLLELAYARSGDKGNICNIGLIARKPEYYPVPRATRHRRTSQGTLRGSLLGNAW